MGLRKVAPGEDINITAETWNSFIDAAVATRSDPGSGKSPTHSVVANSAIIPIRNGSIDDVERFSVLGIGAPLILPSDNELEFQNRLVMNCIIPTGYSVGNFVLLLDSIPSGQFGRGIVVGLTPAWVNIVDTSHTWCDVEIGTTDYLVSTQTGSAKIIWVDGSVGNASETGEQWCVVLLTGIPAVECDAD